MSSQLDRSRADLLSKKRDELERVVIAERRAVDDVVNKIDTLNRELLAHVSSFRTLFTSRLLPTLQHAASASSLSADRSPQPIKRTLCRASRSLLAAVASWIRAPELSIIRGFQARDHSA